MIYFSYNAKKIELQDNCGTGAGGFRSGNTCATKRAGILGGNRERLYEIVEKEGLLDKVKASQIKEYAEKLYNEVGKAKIKEAYGKTPLGKIQGWLDTDHGDKFKNAVAKSIKYYGKGSIGALGGINNDKFKIIGTAFASPAILPLVLGESVISGFFKGVVQEYQKQVGQKAVQQAVQKQTGMEAKILKTELQEDPNLNDVIEYLKDVLAVSIRDYISDKKKDSKLEDGDTCPLPTQDIKVNLANRQKAIDTANYGPANPKEPNEEYWAKKAKIFGGSVKEAKTMLCGNCAGFNKTSKLLGCISKGIGTDAKEVEQAGDLGYCEIFDFKCASLRTCDAWIVGGPIQDKTEFADNCGTGSGGFKEGNTCAKGSKSGGIFISPSTEENQDFKSAKAKIDSGEQARAVSLSKDIIKDQGMKGEFKSAIGDWEDGAENAIKIEVQDAQDYDQIAYTAAKLGSMFKQKAVIAFENKNDGQDSIYKISAPKGMDEMRKILSDNGIKFRTIFEDRGKSNVTIFDKGSELLSKINNVMEVANATGQIIKGVGEFIGGDTRIQGEQAYRKVIADYETKFPTRTRHRFSAGIGLHYNGSAYQLENCGTGAGGFKEGNTCAKGGGGGTTMTPSWARENPEKASKETAKTTTLFHGTSVDVLKSIKEKGLLPSKSGVWGGGKVYSTDSLDLAMEYGVLRATGAKAKVAGRTMIGIVSVLAEGFQSVADNIPTVKAQKMGKTGLAAVSKIFTKDGAVSPKAIRKIDIFDVDSIRKYVYENGPKPKALATKELEDGKKYIYVPIVIDIPEGEEDENLAYGIGGAGVPAGTIPTAVIQGQGKERDLSAYTKPKLRERIKNRILRGTKGGRAGQWSARKAQLLVQAYEKAGGGYTGKKTKGQSSLKKWTKEKWRTSDNSKSIQRGEKTKRYLPSRVWDKLSPAEKAAANRTKAQGSKKGKQFVPNPPSVTKKFSYNGQAIELNCGTGSGGFKEGNTCAKGGGGNGGGKGKGKSEKDESEKDREKLLKEIDAEIERLMDEPKAKDAVRRMQALREEVAKAEGVDDEFASATRWSLRDPSRYVQSKDLKATFDNPTPEHKKWRDEVIASELNPNAKSDNPIAVILMGSPASGKTTTGRPFAQKILGGKETTNIDPDSVKAKSKGFEGWNAGAFHEESSFISEKMILGEAIKNRHNVLLDITGRNSDKVADNARTLKSLGYTIGLVHVDVDDMVALKRASARFNKPNGRWVPYDYIKGSADAARKTWNKLTKEGIADIGYSIDGNAERVQGKDAPVKEIYGKTFE